MQGTPQRTTAKSARSHAGLADTEPCGGPGQNRRSTHSQVRAADRAARRAEVFAELHAAGIRFREWAWPRIATARAVAMHKAGLAWAWIQPRLVELGVRLVERFMRTVERFDDASRNRRARRAAERAGRSDR